MVYKYLLNSTVYLVLKSPKTIWMLTMKLLSELFRALNGYGQKRAPAHVGPGLPKMGALREFLGPTLKYFHSEHKSRKPS